MSADADSFSELVSRACHDLRTPLASAFGFARTLERLGAVQGDHARYLGLVVESTEELGRLIDALALLARAEDGRLVLERAPARTDEVAAAACALVPGDRVTARGPGGERSLDRARLTSALAWLAEATAHAIPGEAPLVLDARADGTFALGPLPETMDDRLVDGTGDLRARAARAAVRAHGGTLARVGDRVVVRLAAT